jgi:hypothetical protein
MSLPVFIERNYYAVVRHEGNLIRHSLETVDPIMARKKLGDLGILLSHLDASLGMDGRRTVEEVPSLPENSRCEPHPEAGVCS